MSSKSLHLSSQHVHQGCKVLRRGGLLVLCSCIKIYSHDGIRRLKLINSHCFPEAERLH